MVACAATAGLPVGARGRLAYIEDDEMADELSTGLWGGGWYTPEKLWFGLRKTDACGTLNAVPFHPIPSPSCLPSERGCRAAWPGGMGRRTATGLPSSATISLQTWS